MAAAFECAMLACFGFSWPINMVKSFRSRTAKGKSLFFAVLIIIGYLFGIASKIVNGSVNGVLVLYFVNVTFVTIDACVTLRNKKLDRIGARLSTGSGQRGTKTLDCRSVGEAALANKLSHTCEDMDVESEAFHGKDLDDRRSGKQALEKDESGNYSTSTLVLDKQ